MKSGTSARTNPPRRMTILTMSSRWLLPWPRVKKIPGARACLIHDHFSAKQGVEDDHMNILCIGGRTAGPAVAWDLVQTFLAAQFSQAERHLRRLGKVASLEGRTKRTLTPK